eukprot:6954458-Alexandrium_andersonii.AAC.1
MALCDMHLADPEHLLPDGALGPLHDPPEVDDEGQQPLLVVPLLRRGLGQQERGLAAQAAEEHPLPPPHVVGHHGALRERAEDRLQLELLEGLPLVVQLDERRGLGPRAPVELHVLPRLLEGWGQAAGPGARAPFAPLGAPQGEPGLDIRPQGVPVGVGAGAVRGCTWAGE